MGLVRTLLAISVLLSHALNVYGPSMVGGRGAVQLFYIISGFLISYIVVERKSYNSVTSFYINRYLRLYPVYALIAAGSLCFIFSNPESANSRNFFAVYGEHSASTWILLIFSNTFIFLQDWVMFLKQHDGHLFLITSQIPGDTRLFWGLLIPQAWTLGVELSFYLIAPFVLTRRYAMLGLFLASVALRFWLVKMGLGRQDPWTYRFFPNELALFLLGSLSHQFLAPLYARLAKARLDRLSVLATAVVGFIIVFFDALPANKEVKGLMLYLFLAGILPLLFSFQNHHAWDRWVGELSYPVYLCHTLVLDVTYGLLKHLDLSTSTMGMVITPVVLVGSLAVSIIINRYISQPVEFIRNRFRRATR